MSENRAELFFAMHQAASPLLLPNAWDAASALLFQNAGAQAIATSSAAVAWSLGYADGGSLPEAELLGAIRRIVRVLQVPLSIDLETGYSDQPQAVAELIGKVAECGAVGINIEDGTDSPELLAAKLTAARTQLAGKRFFINARTDVYLRGLAQGAAAVQMAADRLNAYQRAGADGGFVPGMSALDEASSLAAQLSMPLNLMAVPNIASMQQLHAAGVRRISAGPSLFQAGYGLATELAKNFLTSGQAADLYAGGAWYASLNGLFSR